MAEMPKEMSGESVRTTVAELRMSGFKSLHQAASFTRHVDTIKQARDDMHTALDEVLDATEEQALRIINTGKV